MGQGETTNTLDAKGRLAIPPGMRVELLGQDNRPPVLTRLLEAPALGLYTAERWAEFRRRLDSLSRIKTSVQRVRRHIVGGAKEAPIDAQGRPTREPAQARHLHDCPFRREISGKADEAAGR